MTVKHPTNAAAVDVFVHEIEDCTITKTFYCTTCIRMVSDPCVSEDDSSDWSAWKIHADKYYIEMAMFHCVHADDSADHQV